MRTIMAVYLSLFCLTTPAGADPYVSIFGGLNFSKNKVGTSGFANNMSGELIPLANLVESDTSHERVIGGAFGYQIAMPSSGAWRLELEGSSEKSEEGELFLPINGTEIAPGVFWVNYDNPTPDFAYNLYRTTSGMFNAVYLTPPIGGGLHPYFGGGVGAAKITLDSKKFTTVEILDAIKIGELEETQEDFLAFQWQVLAGVSVDVTKSLEFFVEGRFRRASRSERNELSNGVIAIKQNVTTKHASGGLRYKF